MLLGKALELTKLEQKQDPAPNTHNKLVVAKNTALWLAVYR